jgi:hypothetical protein
MARNDRDNFAVDFSAPNNLGFDGNRIGNIP